MGIFLTVLVLWFLGAVCVSVIGALIVGRFAPDEFESGLSDDAGCGIFVAVILWPIALPLVLAFLATWGAFEYSKKN